jgi:hypothetical protein
MGRFPAEGQAAGVTVKLHPKTDEFVHALRSLLRQHSHGVRIGQTAADGEGVLRM